MQDEQLRHSLGTVMASKLPKLTLDLRAPGERKWRVVMPDHVESVDLIVERDLWGGIPQAFDEVIDGFRAIGSAVVALPRVASMPAQ